MLEWYPGGHTPTVEKLEQYISELAAKRERKNAEYNTADQKSRELSEAVREIDAYLRKEQSRNQHKKRKRTDLE